MFSSVVSILIAIIYLVMKLIYWDRFAAGMAPVLIGMGVVGSIQLGFIGRIGEYVLSLLLIRREEPEREAGTGEEGVGLKKTLMYRRRTVRSDE